MLEEERVKEFTTDELVEFNAAVATVNRLLHGEA